MEVKGEKGSLNSMLCKWDTLSIPLTVNMITSQLKRNYRYSGIMMMLLTNIRTSLLLSLALIDWKSLVQLWMNLLTYPEISIID